MEKKITLLPGTKMSIECGKDGGIITLYEPEKENINPRFEDGDIIYVCDYDKLHQVKEWAIVIIRANPLFERGISYYVKLNMNDELSYCDNMPLDWDDIRFYSKSDKKRLFDALARDGKQWNAEKKCIEELRWKPKEHEPYYYISDEMDIEKTLWVESVKIDRLRYDNYNCFRTKEEAEKGAEKALPYIIEAFKNRNKK